MSPMASSFRRGRRNAFVVGRFDAEQEKALVRKEPGGFVRWQKGQSVIGYRVVRRVRRIRASRQRYPSWSDPSFYFSTQT
jgi:hypothetical protein